MKFHRPLAAALALSALAACPSASAPRPARPTAPASARGGFVVVTLANDGAYATDLVPSDPAAPPMSLAGVWVFDDAATPPRLAVIADAAQACGCPAACDAAASPFVAPDDIKDDYFLCDQPPFQSLVGGVIVAAVEEHSDTCHSGLNLYSIEQRDWDLGGAKTTWAPPDVSALDRALAAGSPGAASMCFERGGHGELDIGGGATCLARGTGWIDADETGSDCGFCGGRFTTAVPYLADGQLTIVRDDWQGVGEGPRRLDQLRLDAASCPSAADPCGDTARFAHVPEIAHTRAAWAAAETAGVFVGPPGAHFWVASDGSLALVADLERRVYRVWGPDPAAPGPLRSAPFAARPGAVILGVRYHRDLAPIVARACAATCDSERCTAALPARDCDALEREKDYPCEYGPDAPGDDGDDNVIGAEPDAPDLDARARALTGSASDLGNRCFRQLQAAELDEARATCAEALRRKPSDATRGAILFNLGLIAEKRGDPAEARRLYRESLAARPNATVRKRLDALGP